MNEQQTRLSIARDNAMERLGFKTVEITERIIQRLVSPGLARVRIVVPHNSFRQQFAGGIAYALTIRGLPIVAGSLTRYLGEGYDVSIDPVSELALKGQVFDTIYMPPYGALTAKQRREYDNMQIHIQVADATTDDFRHIIY